MAGIYAIVAIIVLILFNRIRYNPIDNTAMTFIWESEEIGEQVGEILHVGRYIAQKTVKNETDIIVPYVIETTDKEYMAYITMRKADDNWIVTSYEIKERK